MGNFFWVFLFSARLIATFFVTKISLRRNFLPFNVILLYLEKNLEAKWSKSILQEIILFQKYAFKSVSVVPLVLAVLLLVPEPAKMWSKLTSRCTLTVKQPGLRLFYVFVNNQIKFLFRATVLWNKWNLRAESRVGWLYSLVSIPGMVVPLSEKNKP